MNLSEFKSRLTPYRALMGFDFGTKRLGIAVSDLMLMIATPQKPLICRNPKEDLKAIGQLIEQYEIGGLVYGLPLQMDGTEGDTAAAVRTFAARLDGAFHLPYTFWDERLSSRAMENFLIKEVDMSRAKRKDILDSSSAGYILQGCLDALSRL